MVEQPPDPAERELQALCLCYLDGELSADEVQALRDRLVSDPTTARQFVETIQIVCLTREQAQREQGIHEELALPSDTSVRSHDVLEELLRLERDAPILSLANEPALAHQPPVERNPSSLGWGDVANATSYLLTKSVKSAPARWAAAAVVLLAVTLLVVLVLGDETPSSPVADQSQGETANTTSVEKPLSAVATLTAEQDAVWAEGAFAPGSPMRAGQSLTLTQGFAEITTRRGAVAILQAPSTIKIIDENWIALDSGTLIGRCTTVASRGFTVDTPQAQIVDIGTRFGVSVDTAGETSLEVFTGEITVAPIVSGRVDAATRLIKGETARVSGGRIARVPLSADPLQPHFANVIAFEKQYSSLAYQSRVLQDPSLIAYYGLETPGGTVLRESRGQSLFDAQIVGARWAEGRHPGKHALEFTGKAWEERVELSQRASDQLNLQDAFTITMWVNLHDIPDGTKWTAIATKGNNDWRILCIRNRKTGDPHIGFYRSIDKADPAMRFTGVGSDDIEFNRWHHIVVTGQPEGDGVLTKLYLDGQLKSSEPFPRPLQSNHPVVFGANAIANASEPMVFDGELGEVAFFNRAVPEDEVRQLYHASTLSGSQP